MTSPLDRQQVMQLIDEATLAGARLACACAVLGLTARTVQRWRHATIDSRPTARRPTPPNALSDAERAQVRAVANNPEHASLTPHQIVPKLADEHTYLCSESTMYRLLRASGQQRHRGRSKAPQRRPLTTHCASAPNQLWCWDITWMPSTVKGHYFYWYMIKDVHSRYLVANEVHANESAELAGELVGQACLRQRTAGKPLVLHSDNGGAMKGASMLHTLYELGIDPSFSRPRVSNDNAYAEALFRTAKYCPLWPEKPFDTLDEARQWVQRFVHWYNTLHHHSALRYVTPHQRHYGQAQALLEQRKKLYASARDRRPERWSGATRNWHLSEVVYLNPERVGPTEAKAA
jgi:transposase InsO family protein